MTPLWKWQCKKCKVTIGPSEATEMRFGICAPCAEILAEALQCPDCQDDPGCHTPKECLDV